MDNVIRLLPPLILKREEAELLLATLVPLITGFLARAARAAGRRPDGLAAPA